MAGGILVKYLAIDLPHFIAFQPPIEDLTSRVVIAVVEITKVSARMHVDADRQSKQTRRDQGLAINLGLASR